MSNSKNMKVAFIGGGPTTINHVKAFQGLENVKLIGIYNRTIEKANQIAKAYEIEHVYNSIEDLYEQSMPDLVVISVYEPAKLEILSKCIPYLVPILTEKPIGINYYESNKIEEICRHFGTEIWVGLNRRNYNSTLQAHKLLDEFNDQKRIVEIIDQQNPEEGLKNNHSIKVINHWMHMNSIHLIDYCTNFCRGNLVDIEIKLPFQADNPEVVIAMLTYDSGDIGLYRSYWNRPAPWACMISTEKLFIEMQPLESLRYQVKETKWINIARSDDDVNYKPGFRRQADQIIKACLGDKNANVVSIQEAMKSTHLLKFIYGR